ncbi:antibiotic biosynthesis monooxygenase [Muricauda sp. SCSIO 64092]|uniref:antibiotic biosynthesis monooxygenase family protein n=1 Tax=Allomuricauda sp. SCSIO 64092 TaxID=2908842 RepID=UPI001FF0EEA8|nr:antibiotic biosynthesis monooxygenase [Muricauda sp. SCSIO 64092]UOY06795.1 antibiotic biosynthesis monooxygenase [Muricauda sp. SCSIO 64092]
MIIRIFKASIPSNLQIEFETKFKEVSVPLVKRFKGLISLEIAGPTIWNPDEFVMISKWNTERDLIEFAGENWNQAHIPKGMEKYIEKCTVSHHRNIAIT